MASDLHSTEDQLKTEDQLQAVGVRRSERARRRWRLGMAGREAWAFRLFVLPWVLGFLIWRLGPMLFSLFISLTRWDFVDPVKFIGLQNYVNAFTSQIFWQSLKVTSIYSVVRVPLALALALGIAILLNQKVPFLAFWRTVYFLPSVLNGVAVALLFLLIFNHDFGLLNGFLYQVFHIVGPDWLGSAQWVLPSLILMSLWAFGQPMVIFLAGLQGVPPELHEAAQIDGAGIVSRFRHVTLPMLSPVVFFNLILGIIGSFQVFAQALVMTNGGPGNASLFYVLYLYEEGWEFLQMGYASALAWILFFIILGLTLIVVKTSPMWVYYEGSKGS